MKVIIISGGQSPTKEELINQAKDANLIIGADKGCEVLWENNIIPDIIVGDFDSINTFMYEKYRSHSKEYTYNPEKDYTDSDIAFNKAIENGATHIVLLGCTGTRIDHVLANIGLLKKALDLNIKCEIIDGNNKMFLINRNTKFKGSEGQTISFLAYYSKVEKLTIKDAKYPLNQYDLDIGDSLTVSNEFVDKDIDVTFSKGILLVNLSND